MAINLDTLVEDCVTDIENRIKVLEEEAKPSVIGERFSDPATVMEEVKSTNPYKVVDSIMASMEKRKTEMSKAQGYEFKDGKFVKMDDAEHMKALLKNNKERKLSRKKLADALKNRALGALLDGCK